MEKKGYAPQDLTVPTHAFEGKKEWACASANRLYQKGGIMFHKPWFPALTRGMRWQRKDKSNDLNYLIIAHCPPLHPWVPCPSNAMYPFTRSQVLHGKPFCMFQTFIATWFRRELLLNSNGQSPPSKQKWALENSTLVYFWSERMACMSKWVHKCIDRKCGKCCRLLRHTRAPDFFVASWMSGQSIKTNARLT